MSLNKSIEHKKEKRKPYYGAKAIDPSCRNHGSDGWAQENREYKNLKREASAQSKLDEALLDPMPFAPTKPENSTQ